MIVPVKLQLYSSCGLILGILVSAFDHISCNKLEDAIALCRQLSAMLLVPMQLLYCNKSLFSTLALP